MHKHLPKIYCFIDQLNLQELKKINNNIGIRYRNYDKKIDENSLILIRNYCKKNNQQLYLSNNIKLAVQLRLNGSYIPSFNNKLNTKRLSIPSNFNLIGSAHNRLEVKIKEKQGCKLIFLAPVFKVFKKNQYLDICKFNYLSLSTAKKTIALGGINRKNINKINMLRCYGIAGISWIKKNGLSLKPRPFLNL